MKDNIILIGFMGSGKTTLGIRLSYRLKMPVEDTDKMIEQREGKSVSDIFKEDGEEYFRKRETELLKYISTRKYSRIISVGGGTPVKEENRPLLKKCGIVVYLRAEPETVYERLKDDTTRPLLACDDPLSKIRSLMESRSKAYEESADIILDVDSDDTDEIINKVIDEIKVYIKDKNNKKNNISSKERNDKMKILVINGPNINFLGIREKSVYGTQDYQYLLDMISKKADETGNDITVFQSNHEGAIIDRIQEAYFDGTDAIVINPGAYTHYSYAIRDALASITVTKVEIHISDITKREDFRKTSVTAPVCDRQIYGQGLDGYIQAIDFVIWKHEKFFQK